MLYRRTGLQLAIEQQRGEEDVVKGYVDTLQRNFPSCEVTKGRGSLLRIKYTVIFKTIEDALAAEQLIDTD